MISRPNSGSIAVGRMLSSIDYIYAMCDNRCVLVSDKSGGFCKFDVRQSSSSNNNTGSITATATTSHKGKHYTNRTSSGGGSSSSSSNTAIVKQYTASQSNRLISYKAQFSVCAETIAVVPGTATTSVTANSINTNSSLHIVDLHTGHVVKTIDSGLRNVTVARNLYSSSSSGSNSDSDSSNCCYDTDIDRQTTSLHVWCTSYMNEQMSRLALRPMCNTERGRRVVHA
jgi:hypothetical protein